MTCHAILVLLALTVDTMGCFQTLITKIPLQSYRLVVRVLDFHVSLGDVHSTTVFGVSFHLFEENDKSPEVGLDVLDPGPLSSPRLVLPEMSNLDRARF